MKTRRHYPECPHACCPNGVVQGSVLQGMVRTPVKRVSEAAQSQPVASFLTVNSVIRRRASFSGRSRSGSVRASAASRRCRGGSHRNLGGEHLPGFAFPQDHHVGRSRVQLSRSVSEVDPVCGVEVDPAATIESIEHEGVTCLGARWGPAWAPGEASSRPTRGPIISENVARSVIPQVCNADILTACPRRWHRSRGGGQSLSRLKFEKGSGLKKAMFSRCGCRVVQSCSRLQC